MNSTVTALREQLARAETALDRERAQQHETVALLRGLIASRPESPEPKAARRQLYQPMKPGGGAGLTARPAAATHEKRRNP